MPYDRLILSTIGFVLVFVLPLAYSIAWGVSRKETVK